MKFTSHFWVKFVYSFYNILKIFKIVHVCTTRIVQIPTKCKFCTKKKITKFTFSCEIGLVGSPGSTYFSKLIYSPICLFCLGANSGLEGSGACTDRAAGRSPLTVPSAQISWTGASAALMSSRWQMMGDPCRACSGTGFAH